mmetsp:Transcript_86245/g.247484  ORF Transcript_86245/g.247484 Transcript_86245/m.247484 type:complete len:85 (-) Transcript_86245:177-431(-)
MSGTSSGSGWLRTELQRRLASPERECTLPDFLGVGRCFASSGGAKGNQAPHHVFIAVVDFNVHEPSYWIVRCGAHDPSLLVRRP